MSKTDKPSRIFKGSDAIDFNNIKVSAPKVNPKGGKVVNIMNKVHNESILIESPMMLTWGAQERLDQEKNPTGNFTMSLQFPNEENYSEEANNFLAMMQMVEQYIKDTALERSNEWFGKVIKSAEVIDEKFNVMLRHPKIKGSEAFDLSKPPTLTVKFPCWKGVWQTEVYDERGNPLFLKSMSSKETTPLEFITPRVFVKVLLQCAGIWFVNGKISITWNAIQIVVKNSQQSMEGTCLLSFDNDMSHEFADNSVYENDVKQRDHGKKAMTQGLTIIDDDEEDNTANYNGNGNVDIQRHDTVDDNDGVEMEVSEDTVYNGAKKQRVDY